MAVIHSFVGIYCSYCQSQPCRLSYALVCEDGEADGGSFLCDEVIVTSRRFEWKKHEIVSCTDSNAAQTVPPRCHGNNVFLLK